MSVLLQQKEKIKKIIKFEKIMKKFCKDIGVDKKTLLTMFIGGVAQVDGSNVRNESGKKETIRDSLTNISV